MNTYYSSSITVTVTDMKDAVKVVQLKHSLQCVLNYRRLRLYEGDLELAKLVNSGPTMYAMLEHQLKQAKKSFENYGHSGGSYYWTKNQSIKIDQMGWESWLESKDAQDGYTGIGLELELIGRHQ